MSSLNLHTPDQADAHYRLGLLAMQANRTAEGLSHFKKALDADPTQQRYWLGYIDALIQDNQLNLARQVLRVGLQGGLMGAGIDALKAKLDESRREAEELRFPENSVPDQQAMNALMTLFNQGQYGEMERLARTMTELYSQHGVAWKALGTALLQLGRVQEALAPMQQALALLPEDVSVHNNLGNIFNESGRFVEAEDCLRRALMLNADFAEAHYNLGNTFRAQGRWLEAEASYRRALEINPANVNALFKLAKILWKQGQLLEAETCLCRLLELNLASAGVHFVLGSIFLEQGRFSEAEVSFRQVLKLKPDSVDAHLMLGNTLKQQGRSKRAIECYRQVLELQPDNVAAHCNLGVALLARGRLPESEACLSKALMIDPNAVEAHSNFATVFSAQGRVHDAEMSLRHALAIKPDYTEIHSNLIFMLDLMTDVSPASLQEERKRWSEVHTKHIPQYPMHTNMPVPERRLRIGYVSADMSKHSAAKVFSAMLLRFDHSRFDVIAYSNIPREDDHSRLMKQSVTRWRNIVGMSDKAVAELIRQDGIDILVDLSGHSAGNRLLVFARKPAPIQITAWGYIGGTGMKAMDVFFADPVIVPPEEKILYAEDVRYLPNVVGLYSVDPFPEINTLPALAGKGITFGSFNRLVKISDLAYQTWAQVLATLPDSRMLLKEPSLDDANTRERVLDHFKQFGIDPQRITLLGRTDWQQHMTTFNQIDIALDPFPHGGGVTALEGLMMGVPTVTLRWPTLVGRLSASILTTVGLSDWIAETPEQYVEIAVQKVANLSKLAELRQQLRPLFTSSIIGDADAYVRTVENEYRQLWREWCARQSEGI